MNDHTKRPTGTDGDGGLDVEVLGNDLLTGLVGGLLGGLPDRANKIAFIAAGCHRNACGPPRRLHHHASLARLMGLRGNALAFGFCSLLRRRHASRCGLWIRWNRSTDCKLALTVEDRLAEVAGKRITKDLALLA